jgi:hypothetical protein
MARLLKPVKIAFWVFIATIMVSSIVVVSIVSNSSRNAPHLPYERNISNEYSSLYKNSIEKSRFSAVQVRSVNLLLGRTSSLSGTYFVANDNHYVITSAHGIAGPCFLTKVVYKDQTHNCEEFMIVDEKVDYAIMRVEGAVLDRTPIRIPEDLPYGAGWKRSYSILNKIIYTGYPNSIGPLTLKGDVVGYADTEYLYVFSYAYGGSSGSGVFSTTGKYIGLVTAIDVGQTEFGFDTLENVVLVTPAFKIDWNTVLN